MKAKLKSPDKHSAMRSIINNIEACGNSKEAIFLLKNSLQEIFGIFLVVEENEK
jgi:hypothetical protein